MAIDWHTFLGQNKSGTVIDLFQERHAREMAAWGCGVLHIFDPKGEGDLSAPWMSSSNARLHPRANDLAQPGCSWWMTLST